MSRGRAASLPASPHQRPRPLQDLVVVHVDEKGEKTARYDFGALPIPPRLQHEFAALVADRARPTGSWRNLPTSRQGWQMVGQFARWLAAQDTTPTQIAEIDRATWLRWTMSRSSAAGGRRAVRVLTLLLRDHPELPVGTRREMGRRQPDGQSFEPSYNDEELGRIVGHARRVFRAAHDRIGANVAHLRAFRSGLFAENSKDFRLGQALEVLAGAGDVPHRRLPASGTRYVPVDVAAVLGGSVAEVTWKRLFLDDYEAFAALVLIACEQGWNYTTIAELPTPTNTGGTPDRPLYSIQLEKRRRYPPHRYETRLLLDDGPRSAGRLLTRILAATAPARALRAIHEAPSDRLLLFRLATVKGVRGESFGSAGYVTDEIGGANGAQLKWRADTGSRVNFRRIRKAVNVRYLRQPNQNGRNTHDEVYVLTDPGTALEVESVIAAWRGSSDRTRAGSHGGGLRPGRRRPGRHCDGRVCRQHPQPVF